MSIATVIVDRFKGFNEKQAQLLEQDSALLQKCKYLPFRMKVTCIGVELCTLYSLDPSELTSKWDAFLLNNKKDADTSLNEKMLEKFKTTLSNSHSQQFVKKPKTSSRVYDKTTLNEYP
jgi:hypothetical protein